MKVNNFVTNLWFSGETKTEWEDIYFIPVCCFVLFNFGDYLGKELATRLRWPKPSKTGQLIILSMSIIRAGMIPLFMFCNVAPSNRSTEVKDIFHELSYYHLFAFKQKLWNFLNCFWFQLSGCLFIWMVVYSFHGLILNIKWLHWKYWIYVCT